MYDRAIFNTIVLDNYYKSDAVYGVMIMEVNAGECMDLGVVLTDGAARLVEEAVDRLPATEYAERAYVRGLIGRIRRGELGVYTLSAGGRAVGVVCYRLLDGDAELVFGNMAATGCEGCFLRRIADDLFSSGTHTIRSGFAWPHASGFIAAAERMGFVVTERIGMARDTSSPEPPAMLCGGFELLTWDNEYVDDVCRIMCDHYAPSDRNVYPALTTYEGASTLLRSVIVDRHGKFLPELSLVAKADDKIVGFLISTLLLDGSVLVLDIAVDGDYRRKGIGSAMMRQLIRESFAKCRNQVVLAVTSVNEEAIRLYERLGFKKNMAFRQYVLSRY